MKREPKKAGVSFRPIIDLRRRLAERYAIPDEHFREDELNDYVCDDYSEFPPKQILDIIKDNPEFQGDEPSPILYRRALVELLMSPGKKLNFETRCYIAIGLMEEDWSEDFKTRLFARSLRRLKTLLRERAGLSAMKAEEEIASGLRITGDALRKRLLRN
jgi:hypothetical protein